VANARSRAGEQAQLRVNSCTWKMPQRLLCLPQNITISPDPVNIGSGHEITIRELAELLCKLTGFEGELIWDATQPDGQPRRRLNVSRAERESSFLAQTSPAEGLRDTIEWYQNCRMAVANRS
jgi:nucleoside-diphosphate-sugar epimerase